MESRSIRSKVRAGGATVAIVALWLAGMPSVSAAPPICLGASATIIGTSGDDELVGTSGPDVIVGLGGSDTIRGLGGDDRICGGEGDDHLFGGPGDDDIAGGRGNDELFGRTGDDGLFGGSGNDISRGGPGDDYILSWWGDDKNYGGSGFNRILAGPGNDLLVAGPLGDSLDGGPGDDTVIGGAGGDVILDSSGNNSIRLGAGYDIAIAGDGDDNIFGGRHDDLLAGLSGNDRLWGGPGNDLLIGGSGADRLSAAVGNDLCDKDGNERPSGCEHTKELSYRTVTVQAKGTGTDPTNSGFGDPFFRGTIVGVDIYQADFFPEYLENAMPVASATMRGNEFTVSVPVADSVISMYKTFPTWDMSDGQTGSTRNGPSVIQATIKCCDHFGAPWSDSTASTALTWHGTTVDMQRFDLGRPMTADMTE